MTKTSNEEIPKHKNALLDLYATKEEIEERFLDPSKLTTSLKERLPQPTGWRVLVMPWSGPKKTAGGIILPDNSHEAIAVATTTAYVIKTGPLAYADKEKFPNGPWCKDGDWVMFGRYAGSRFKIEGGELRILNDDEIIATILDPRDVKHAL
jgi:chaperonin GroES|uniref:Co-chaperonin GroES n=1 Tax=uncultured virus TaxID=340016 RepID=A0A221S3K4_9VIRU|nr:co-chaperonin GroES [uncultured virus]